jgi:hypothetical protein
MIRHSELTVHYHCFKIALHDLTHSQRSRAYSECMKNILHKFVSMLTILSPDLNASLMIIIRYGHTFHTAATKCRITKKVRYTRIPNTKVNGATV